jgi:hypothetical protein
MSTVTLSNPHCAITSAENPDGIASQAFTTALPEAQTFLTLLVAITFPSLCPNRRHCDERSDEANQLVLALDGFAAPAMTEKIMP